MNNERGGSLVEILLGMFLLSIIIFSIGQLILQSNSTAEANKNQLVVIHLTDAMLKRLQIENDIVKDAVPQSDTWDSCINIPLSNDFAEVTINGETFSVSACLTPRNDDNPIVKEKLDLVNVRVRVEDRTGRRKSEIEGFVQL